MKTDQQLWVELKWGGVGGFEENHGLSFSQVNFCDKIAFDLNFLFNRRFCCILCVLIILCVYTIKIIKITALCIFTKLFNMHLFILQLFSRVNAVCAIVYCDVVYV